MQVVVTGGAGFIGANLVRTLLSHAWPTIVLDDFSTGSPKNLPNDINLKIVEGSILDRRILDTAMAGADSIVHLAARPSVARSIADPLTTHEINATGTLEVLECARRWDIHHVIVASSSSVYGSNPQLPKREDNVPMPMSPYAVSKLATESYALAYATCFDIDVLALRLFNVYGPLQRARHAYAAVIPSFVSAALADQPLVIYGDGLQTRDFTFVDSVVSVILSALSRRVAAAVPINVAFGERVSLLAIIEQLEAIVQHPLIRLHVDARLGDVRHSQADSGRLRALIPDSTGTTLHDGLEQTVAWFRSQAGSDDV